MGMEGRLCRIMGISSGCDGVLAFFVLIFFDRSSGTKVVGGWVLSCLYVSHFHLNVRFDDMD